MGRGRDEDGGALPVAPGEVVAADREEPGELALGAGVGLDGDRGVAGDLREPGLELGDELAPAEGLALGLPAALLGRLVVIPFYPLAEETLVMPSVSVRQHADQLARALCDAGERRAGHAHPGRDRVAGGAA